MKTLYLVTTVFLGHLQANLVERPPVPGVVLLLGDLERGYDGNAGGGVAILGADGDEAREGEEFAVQEVVVAEGLVAHGGAGPAARLEKIQISPIIVSAHFQAI